MIIDDSTVQYAHVKLQSSSEKKKKKTLWCNKEDLQHDVKLKVHVQNVLYMYIHLYMYMYLHCMLYLLDSVH